MYKIDQQYDERICFRNTKFLSAFHFDVALIIGFLDNVQNTEQIVIHSYLEISVTFNLNSKTYVLILRSSWLY